MSSRNAAGLQLAESALNRMQGTLARAAIDITTGYGIDSFIVNQVVDPWGTECVQRFADVLIHHDDVVYPAPSWKALAPEVLQSEDPAIFGIAKQRATPLLRPYREATAEDGAISAHDLEALWMRFHAWALHDQNARYLREWLRLPLHRSSTEDGRWRVIDEVWPRLETKPMLRFVGTCEADLRYAFDIFSRTVRYHRILGEGTVYFPHPLRAEARLRSEASFDGMTWSWGRFLSRAMANLKRRSTSWLIDQIEAIRGAANEVGPDANWYVLSRRPQSQQTDVITEIASRAGLPANLQRNVQNDAKLLISGVSAASRFVLPLVGLTITLTSLLAAQKSTDSLPSFITRSPLVRGHLRWPGLFFDDRGPER